MAAKKYPKNYQRVDAHTLIVRVPRVDWQAIKSGRKTEFRTVGRYSPRGWANLATPVPLLAYSMQRFRDEAETTLLVLEESWVEPLGSISTESLAREGFHGERAEALFEFRRYWRNRHQRVGFRPLTNVLCLRVRPLRPVDYPEAGLMLLRRLYGEHLET